MIEPDHPVGVDNVLELSLVTADAEYITANAYQHADLFWALRGGGGGTLGVVTSVTYRTYPIVPVLAAALVASSNTSEPNPAMKAAFTELVRISANLTDEGWGGYIQFSPLGNATTYSLALLAPNASVDAANKSVQPYFDFVQKLAAEYNTTGDSQDVFVVEQAAVAQFPSFWTLYETYLTGTGQVGVNLELGSWLMPRDALEKDYDLVAQTLIANPGLSYE